MEGYGIIGTIVVGFLAGLLARAIYPGDQKAGILVTIALGVVGSWVANFLGRAIGLYHSSAAGLIGSVVGAVIVLAVYLFVQKRLKKN